MAKCLNCKEEILWVAGAMGDEPRGPDPGDYMICGTCGYAQAIRDDFELRELTPREKRFVTALRKKSGLEIYKH